MECLVLGFRKASSQQASLLCSITQRGALLHLGSGAQDTGAGDPMAELFVFLNDVVVFSKLDLLACKQKACQVMLRSGCDPLIGVFKTLLHRVLELSL